MNYLRGMLSGVAGIVLALVASTVLGLISSFRGIGNEKATGLAAVAGGLTEALFSPLLWILAAAFTWLFWRASRLNSKTLRVLLFWTPVVIITVVSGSVVALYVFLIFHFMRG